MRVKICGITRPADALAAEAAGADAIGLMFVPESPRLIDMGRARDVTQATGPLLQKVGVFRNAPLEQVLDTVRELRLSAVQLHGNESVSYLLELRRVVPVLRAMAFSLNLERAELEALPADAVLLDGLRPGSGQRFDWQQAGHLRALPRLVLAGGLDPWNVAAGVRALAPYGVDVSSGVEQSTGIKSFKLMSAFVSAARGAVPEKAA